MLLGSGAEAALLDLGEVAYAAARPDLRARTKMRVRADLDILRDDRGALEHGPWLDARVLSDLDPRVDAGGRRVDDRHAVAHVGLGDAAPHALLGHGQPDP